MGSLTIIFTLVSLVAGVLQIILFFKVWGMCNDVRALRNQQCPEQPSQETNNGSTNTSYSGLLISFLLVIVLFVIIFFVGIYS